MAITSILNYSAIPVNQNMVLKQNLVSELFYDLEWVNKKYAIEWWERNGNFNYELYVRVLQEKINRYNDLIKVIC